MNIRELRAFLEIVSQRSFAKAAARLNYAQSSITAQIKSLETELGQRLFERDRNGVNLTSAGARLLPYAQQIIDLDISAKEEVQSSPSYTGTVIISSMETISIYRLPKVFKCFLEAAPAAKIAFKTLVDREIYSGVKTGTTDVAFVIEKDIQLDFANVLKIAREGISLYASPGHPMVNRKPDLQTLAQQRFLFWGQQGSYINAFKNHMALHGFQKLLSVDTINIETVKQCAIEGIGIALLPDISVTEEVGQGRLKRIDWNMPDEFYSFLIWNKHKQCSKTVQFFIETCVDYFQ